MERSELCCDVITQNPGTRETGQSQTASGVRERAEQSAKPRAVTVNDPEKDLRSKIERTW